MRNDQSSLIRRMHLGWSPQIQAMNRLTTVSSSLQDEKKSDLMVTRMLSSGLLDVSAGLALVKVHPAVMLLKV